MPRVVGAATRVVDAPGLSIDELAGNVATKQDTLSIALVKAAAGTAEPWLTLHYDEWICVLKGKVVLEVPGDEPSVEVPAGSTVHIAPGERFRPSFPVDTEYVPVCLPAFRPDRCVREDSTLEGATIAAGLEEQHGLYDAPSPPPAADEDPSPERLHHMTTVAEWEAAKASGSAYFPRTFVEDGHYTHATAVPARLVTTANHFYQDVAGPWVCLTFTRSALKACGIHVRDEQALPVGDKPVSGEWGAWICPHVIGGIPLHVVVEEHSMVRDGPRFVSIEGL